MRPTTSHLSGKDQARKPESSRYVNCFRWQACWENGTILLCTTTARVTIGLNRRNQSGASWAPDHLSSVVAGERGSRSQRKTLEETRRSGYRSSFLQRAASRTAPSTSTQQGLYQDLDVTFIEMVWHDNVHVLDPHVGGDRLHSEPTTPIDTHWTSPPPISRRAHVLRAIHQFPHKWNLEVRVSVLGVFCKLLFRRARLFLNSGPNSFGAKNPKP